MFYTLKNEFIGVKVPSLCDDGLVTYEPFLLEIATLKTRQMEELQRIQE